MDAVKATGEQPPRNGNRSPNFCPHGVYPALADSNPDLDAWIAIAVGTDAEWASLCAAMETPALADDVRFATHAARKAHEDELDEILQAWTSPRNKWTLADTLQDAGIMAAPVENLQDMLDRDPQLADHYQIVRQPVAPDVDITIDREAARWVGAELHLHRAPGLGEHNAEIVLEMLQRSDEDFARLLADDIVS